MRFWIDTEFNDYRGALISMALVGEDGSEWYEVLPCNSPSAWVAQNVIPHLNKAAITESEMRASLGRFLSRYETIRIVADWYEDIQHFCALVIRGPGQCIALPEISFWIDRDVNSQDSLVPHNALEDAKAIRLQSLRM